MPTTVNLNDLNVDQISHLVKLVLTIEAVELSKEFPPSKLMQIDYPANVYDRLPYFYPASIKTNNDIFELKSFMPLQNASKDESIYWRDQSSVCQNLELRDKFIEFSEKWNDYHIDRKNYLDSVFNSSDAKKVANLVKKEMSSLKSGDKEESKDPSHLFGYPTKQFLDQQYIKRNKKSFQSSPTP